MNVTSPLRISLLALASIALLVGCDRKDEQAIRTYSAPKDTPAPAFASQQETANQPDQAAAREIQWTLPPGWKEVPNAEKMRYATIQVSAKDPATVLTVTRMGLQELGPNLRRWAGQVGLEGSDDELLKSVSHADVAGEQADIARFTGPGEAGKSQQSILAAIVPRDNESWIFKLEGPAAVVEAQGRGFEQFLHSVRFAAGPEAGAAADAGQGPHTSSADMDQSFRLAAWKTPPGWQEVPTSNDMRVISFTVGSGDQTAEVVVSRIPADQIGPLPENINRWRGQVGLGPVQDPRSAGFEPATIGGQPGLMLDNIGPQGDAQKQLVVVLTFKGSDGWFVKMLGPKSTVSVQKDAFQDFIHSLQFAPERK